MSKSLDPELLATFLAEVHGYIPAIRDALQAFSADLSRVSLLVEPHRMAHTIAGAAGMIGAANLVTIAQPLEDVLLEVIENRRPNNAETAAALQRLFGFVDRYIVGMQSESFADSALLSECKAFLGQLPPAGPAKSAPTLAEDDPPEMPDPAAFDLTVPDIRELLPSHAPGHETAGGELQDEEADVHDEECLPELRDVFRAEAEEHLRILHERVPKLAVEPRKELIQEIRRSAHTIKGAAATVGQNRVSMLAHRMEDALDRLYDGSLAPTPELLDLLLATTDALEDRVTGRADPDVRGIYARYRGVSKESPAPASHKADVIISKSKSPGPPAKPKAQPSSSAGSETESEPTVSVGVERSRFVRVPIERLDDVVGLVGELVINRSFLEQKLADFRRLADDLGQSAERIRRAGAALETEFEASMMGSGRRGGNLVNRVMPFLGGTDSRVPLGFDPLEFDRYNDFHILTRQLGEATGDTTTLAGELTQLVGDLDNLLATQARIVGGTEDKLMRLRMVPLQALGTRLARVVRQTAEQVGKVVDFEIQGEMTEIDKTILEEITDPLLHLLRNSVDHGIEAPQMRRAAGKNERGSIVLRADQEGNQLVLRLQDDGGGLRREKIAAVAVERGLISAEAVGTLTDQELQQYIFLPGFSTAGRISAVSGRGVGMDVVRTTIEKLKGSIRIDSTAGEGTTFTIRLPTTLAVTRALLVRTAQETFALPLDDVRQITRLETNTLDRIGSDEVVRLNGRVYPVIRLAERLRLKHPADPGERPPIVILHAGGREVAILVDRLIGGREIVIKPLPSHLRKLRTLMGASVLGDGTLILVLNPVELAPIEGDLPIVRKPSPSAVALRALRVMVVDDSPSVRRVVGGLLQKAGFEVIVAKDGMEALELLTNERDLPDAVLSDVEMPRMDGYELLAAVRNQPDWRDLPIVFVTSRSGEKHRNKGLELGAADYLQKPFKDDELISVIRRVARRPPVAATGGTS